MSIDEVRDRLAVQDVMLRYAAGVDDRDLELYRACFSEDVEVLGFGSQSYHGREAWIEYVWDALEKYRASQHMLGPSLVTLDGDRAHARTDLQALHYFAEGPSDSFTLWATYETDFSRLEGLWKITRHRLVVRGSKQD